jgi:AraC-like DNA-binding protein/tetratricopeptide (TPR) repeat protein
MKLFSLFVCLFFVGMISYAQQKDVLLDEAIALKKEVFKKDADLETVLVQIQEYLKKAKKSNRKELLGRAYYLLAVKNSDLEKKLQYIDSAIFYTKEIKGDSMFPMKAYFFKGSFLFNKNDYTSALNYYISAESLAKSKGNIEYQYHVKFNIANLNRRIGKYEEAIELFNECQLYEESKGKMNVERYINILFQLSSIYCQTKQVAECTAINKQGIRLALENNSGLYHNFVVNEGINLNIKGNYKVSIDSIEKGVKHLRERHQVISYLYLAKSYDALGKKEKALYYFKSIDSSFNKTGSLFPPLLEAYEYLIKDVEEKNDLKTQLYYTQQIVKIGKVVNRDYKYLSNTIGKKYDFPRYAAKSDELIADLKRQRAQIILVSLLLVMLALGGLLYYYRLKKQYQKRYEAIINQSNIIVEEKITSKDLKQQPVVADIDEDVVQEILQELHQFEQEKDYLTNQISLKDVAKITNTNSKYLSKVINSYKDKNFTTYINDLRIDYLVDQIQHDPIYRKYTIRAIAEEGGFSNPESFFRAFQKRTGLKPSYFIKKVREDQQKKQ